MPRLGHKKSRLGCRQCKARHVKCDELKPCSNCARHGVMCSLVAGDNNLPPSIPASVASSSSNTPKPAKQPLQDPTQPGTSSAPSSSLLIDYVLNPPSSDQGESVPLPAISEGSSPSSQSDSFPFLTRFIHKDEARHVDIWVQDLELMHHWTLEAFDELSQRDDMRHTWRVDAPKHAVSHTFLMHEILAFSALHKAHSLPDQRAQYYACGIHHQDHAIRGVRGKLHDVTAHDAAALVATSTLLTLSVFASTGFELNYPEISNSQDAIEGILDIFSLMQGMGNVLQLAQTQVLNSFLAPMFRDPIDVTPSQPMLQELINQLPTLIAFIESAPHLPDPERKLYLGVIGHFEPVLQMAMPARVDNRELRFLFFWPLHLQPDFINCLRRRHSGALAILMYYTAMLFAAQSRYWFMEGWGKSLMQTCFEDLEQDWHSAVQWPISFINHNTTRRLFASLAQALVSPTTTLQEVDASNTAYSQRRPVEVTDMLYASASHLSHGRRSNLNMDASTQQAAASIPRDDKDVSAPVYLKQSGAAAEDTI